MAVASAGPYASLHLAPDGLPRQHPTTQFFYRPDASKKYRQVNKLIIQGTHAMQTRILGLSAVGIHDIIYILTHISIYIRTVHKT